MTLEMKSSETKDLIEVDKCTVYVVHSEITENGAKLVVDTHTYFTKIDSHNA